MTLVPLPNLVTSAVLQTVQYGAFNDDTMSNDPGNGCLDQIKCFFEDNKGYSHDFTINKAFLSPGDVAISLRTIECGLLP